MSKKRKFSRKKTEPSSDDEEDFGGITIEDELEVERADSDGQEALQNDESGEQDPASSDAEDAGDRDAGGSDAEDAADAEPSDANSEESAAASSSTAAHSKKRKLDLHAAAASASSSASSLSSKLVDVNQIKNKQRRSETFQKLRHEKKLEKSIERRKRKQEAEQTGEPRQEPRTIESMREPDETVVNADDEEALQNIQQDQMAKYFAGRQPKTLLTTSYGPISKFTKEFALLLKKAIPRCHFRPRKGYQLKDIVQFCAQAQYTVLLVIQEHRNHPSGLFWMNLPDGPTADFKLSGISMPKDIKDHGVFTAHYPEVILNNFNTRLGHTLGRMFATPFPQAPDFVGRRIITFHNQRDFIFFRHHRYIFEKKGKSVRTQELGPRFALKLRSLQHGTFDTKHGEYEFVFRKSEHQTRRKFVL